MKFQVSADKRFILMAYNIRPVSSIQYLIQNVVFWLVCYDTVLQNTLHKELNRMIVKNNSLSAVSYSYNTPLICCHNSKGAKKEPAGDASIHGVLQSVQH